MVLSTHFTIKLDLSVWYANYSHKNFIGLRISNFYQEHWAIGKSDPSIRLKKDLWIWILKALVYPPCLINSLFFSNPYEGANTILSIYWATNKDVTYVAPGDPLTDFATKFAGNNIPRQRYNLLGKDSSTSEKSELEYIIDNPSSSIQELLLHWKQYNPPVANKYIVERCNVFLLTSIAVAHGPLTRLARTSDDWTLVSKCVFWMKLLFRRENFFYELTNLAFKSSSQYMRDLPLCSNQSPLSLKVHLEIWCIFGKTFFGSNIHNYACAFTLRVASCSTETLGTHTGSHS